MLPAILLWSVVAAGAASSGAMAAGQARAADAPAFAVASVRPSAERVPFESDGRTTVTPGSLRMQDVTIETCIKWAYGVQRPQVAGPGLLTSERYDIVAKADAPATEDEMKAMMRSLLSERFGLTFHHEQREMRAYALVVVKPSAKLKNAAPREVPSRQNSTAGTVVRAMTLQEFGDFLAGPLEKPVVDKTGLPGRYDFSLDFTNYLPETQPGERPDFLSVMNPTLAGEIGLRLEPQRTLVDVLVVDHVEKPSAN